MRRSVIERFGQLGRYFRDCGVCPSCAITFAGKAVHAEMGRRPWEPPRDCQRPANAATRPCRELATDAWGTRPGL